MRKDENGYMVVETIGSFIPFVLLLISILTLVNIVALQARVHQAMTQTALTVSMYAYTLEITGVAGGIMGSAEAGSQVAGVRNNIDEVIANLTSFSSVSDPASTLANQVGTMAEDPQAALQGILNWAGNQVFAATVARPLVGRYLRNGELSGDAYLRSVNVIDGLDGLDFSGSVFLDANGDIILVVQYYVDYRFGALPLPFPALSITQTVKTHAWLGGSGDGFGGG